MEPHVLLPGDPRARPGLLQFVQDINGKPFAAMLSTRLLDRFPHPDYPWLWVVHLACHGYDPASELPDGDEFEAVKTFAIRVFDRLNLEFDVRFVGTTMHRKNVEMTFVVTEADSPRIAGALSEDLPREFGPDRWRFVKHASTHDAAWVELVDIYQAVWRHAPRPGAPAAPAIDLRLKPEIELHSKRSIRMQELTQSRTYQGLLMGLPTMEGNRRLLDSLPARHRECGQPAHVIKPVEKLMPYSKESGEPYPFGTPARLPPILCVARFTSMQPARNTTADGSGLMVVWFQSHFAFPIEEEAVKAIQAIDWAGCAGDFNY